MKDTQIFDVFVEGIMTVEAYSPEEAEEMASKGKGEFHVTEALGVKLAPTYEEIIAANEGRAGIPKLKQNRESGCT